MDVNAVLERVAVAELVERTEFGTSALSGAGLASDAVDAAFDVMVGTPHVLPADQDSSPQLRIWGPVTQDG